jgi:hypothetical protein
MEVVATVGNGCGGGAVGECRQQRRWGIEDYDFHQTKGSRGLGLGKQARGGNARVRENRGLQYPVSDIRGEIELDQYMRGVERT